LTTATPALVSIKLFIVEWKRWKEFSYLLLSKFTPDLKDKEYSLPRYLNLCVIESGCNLEKSIKEMTEDIG